MTIGTLETTHPVSSDSVGGRAPVWPQDIRLALTDLLAWRRDVRHFRTDPLPAGVIDDLIGLACRAPSVGNAQPWRFVKVESAAGRAAVTANFRQANAAALAAYGGQRQEQYAALKLAGLVEAPVHLAIFCDESASAGHGLGRQTMPEMLRYSVVCAVHTLWLGARVRGIGVGWVSILDPDEARAALDLPAHFSLVAYLCLGWPREEHDVPELERLCWQERLSAGNLILQR